MTMISVLNWPDGRSGGSVCELFISVDCDAVLLVDASDSFDSLNRILYTIL